MRSQIFQKMQNDIFLYSLLYQSISDLSNKQEDCFTSLSKGLQKSLELRTELNIMIIDILSRLFMQ